MSTFWDFIKLPLSLPISPIWDFITCLILEEIAYKIAFSYAGEYGSTSSERGCLHWLIRIPLYLFIWLVVCVIILIVRFVIENWIWIRIVLGILVLVGVIALLIYRNKKQKR